MEAEEDDLYPLDLDDHLLVNGKLEEDHDKDVYRWALLYENQRGATVFSTPYYSDKSLLPMDPPPFTIPSASPSSKVSQPTVSLKEYPLPDGDWRWVSRTWMVDMRGEGRTQYDGFEYNWYFRGKNWRSEVGFQNAGGWVRRRRWVRLMMRPARGTLYKEAEEGKFPGEYPEAEEGVGTRPPSVVMRIDVNENVDFDDVWHGDDEDWTRCRIVMKRLGRDSRLLELWAQWLGLEDDEVFSADSESRCNGRQPRKQRTGDSQLLPSQPIQDETNPKMAESVDRSQLANVVAAHYPEILQLFIFPESRARFLAMLKRANILPELDEKIARDNLDFWSYSDI
ncbi:unnamed protein product [Somion occarium]|uniref:TECPR1-like DysF domain-containing protein n=1 Tax=Somion occarium TaxID=3059160 RepID=A0ABP1CP09_9APHY